MSPSIYSQSGIIIFQHRGSVCLPADFPADAISRYPLRKSITILLFSRPVTGIAQRRDGFRQPVNIKGQFPGRTVRAPCRWSAFCTKSCLISSIPDNPPAGLQQGAVFTDKPARLKAPVISSQRHGDITGRHGMCQRHLHPADVVHATEHQYRTRRTLPIAGVVIITVGCSPSLCVIINAVELSGRCFPEQKARSGPHLHNGPLPARHQNWIARSQNMVIAVESFQRRRLLRRQDCIAFSVACVSARGWVLLSAATTPGTGGVFANEIPADNPASRPAISSPVCRSVCILPIKQLRPSVLVSG